jgi:hypothetical protein
MARRPANRAANVGSAAGSDQRAHIEARGLSKRLNHTLEEREQL